VFQKLEAWLFFFVPVVFFSSLHEIIKNKTKKDDLMFGERRKGGFLKTVFITLLGSMAVAVLIFFYTSGSIDRRMPPAQVPKSDANATPRPQQIAAEVPGGAADGTAGANTPGGISGFNAANVAKNASPGVAGISVLKTESDSIFKPKTVQGVGSGVIVSANGFILTNNHVAGGKTERITVSFIDGRTADGTTVWADPTLDLAIVKVNMTGLTTIPLGDANTVQVGEPAIAIGNPLGLQFQRTVTSGIISALNRTIKIDTDQGPNFMEDLIQTDASINPGNSGGPLLNARGEVIAINTIKVASAEGMGFAVPINVAVPIIRHLIDRGEFVEPYLGVFAYDREVIPYLNNGIRLDNGIYAANVDESGPAFKSGIRVGGIITQVDGRNINTMMQLRTYIYSKYPGDTITVTHINNGQTGTLQIKLAAKEKDGLVTR